MSLLPFFSQKCIRSKCLDIYSILSLWIFAQFALFSWSLPSVQFVPHNFESSPYGNTRDTFLSVVNVVKVRLLSKRNGTKRTTERKSFCEEKEGSEFMAIKTESSEIRGNCQTTSRAFSRFLTCRFLDRVYSCQRERDRGAYLRLYFDSFRWGTLRNFQ